MSHWLTRSPPWDFSDVTLAYEESASDFSDVTLAFEESALELFDVALAWEDDRPGVHCPDRSREFLLSVSY